MGIKHRIQDTVNKSKLRQSVKQKSRIYEPILNIGKVLNLMNKFCFCLIICTETGILDFNLRNSTK